MSWYVYETKGGFYKKTYKWHIAIISLIAACMLFGALFISNTVKSNQLRAANDRLTERCIDAENTCAKLTGELEQCKSTIDDCRGICSDLEESIGRSITTVRDAVEIIEETREAVGEMEVVLGYWDSDSYYERCDNWLESEGVEFIK